jgi:hypothetical protein
MALHNISLVFPFKIISIGKNFRLQRGENMCQIGYVLKEDKKNLSTTGLRTSA